LVNCRLTGTPGKISSLRTGQFHEISPNQPEIEKGRRLKKLETVRLYRCRACDRGFTPGPRALHFAYYNFCRVHSSLRVTPSMEAGIADHVWI
jgi:hypothetical protein